MANRLETFEEYVRHVCAELSIPEEQAEKLTKLTPDEFEAFLRERGRRLKEQAAELRELQARRQGKNVHKLGKEVK